jgi:hypothetical protein
MRKVREVLHLKRARGMSYRRISPATGASKTQAADYVRRAALRGFRGRYRRGWMIANWSVGCSRFPMLVRASVAPSIGQRSNVS